MTRGRLALLVLFSAFIGASALDLPAMEPRTYEQALKASPAAAQSIYRRAQLDHTVPVLGNPKGSVTVVEYFDYQCPYCKVVHEDVKALVRDDPDVRLVMKDWAIFGPASTYAARAALASKWQGKYAEAQDALMQAKGKLDEQRVRDILAKAGIDLARLDADLQANGTEIDRLLRHADDEATAIGLDGTPGFLIGGAVFFGTMDAADLRRIIKEARASPAGAIAVKR